MFRAQTCTRYVPVGRPVVFHVQVLLVLYGVLDQEVPLCSQNRYSGVPDPPLAAAEKSTETPGACGLAGAGGGSRTTVLTGVALST